METLSLKNWVDDAHRYLSQRLHHPPFQQARLELKWKEMHKQDTNEFPEQCIIQGYCESEGDTPSHKKYTLENNFSLLQDY